MTILISESHVDGGVNVHDFAPYLQDACDDAGLNFRIVVSRHHNTGNAEDIPQSVWDAALDRYCGEVRRG